MIPRPVVLVEDESQALSTLIPMISRWNTHLEVFRTVAQLCAANLEGPPPVVILHCRPGELLLNAIGAMNANCPLLLARTIVVTPSVPDQRTLDAMSGAGLHAVAVRPFAARDLIAAIERCASGYLPADGPIRIGVTTDAAIRLRPASGPRPPVR